MPKQQLIGLIMPLTFLAIFYFLLIRPAKKRENNLKKMREALEIGDEVVTIGGLLGRVLKVADDHIIIEVGTDKTRMPIERWGIASKKNK